MITYNSKVDILNKFAIVRSIYTENGWLSLISGIDLLDEEIMIDEYSTTKELLSVRNELGMLTESIKKDSTIISYNNFKQFITPEYSRTNFSDIYNSSYYYDENLYQCAINDYKVLLKKDSISVISPEVESVFHTSGFDVLNISTGFHATLEGEKKLEINSSGCFHFIMDESIATITNDNSIILQSSPENDRLDFTQTFENIKSLNCDDFDFEVLYKNYQINFLLKEDKLNLKYKDFTEQKTIISSNTSLHNMEHIRVDDGAGINDFYIDKNEVTVADYNKFINESGYITEVEKRGWSYIVESSFKSDRKYSQSNDEGISKYLKLEKGYGVNWKCDEFGKPLHMTSQDTNRPVIHINYYDALRYCKWAGKQLPVGDEMFYAAKELINSNNFNNYVMCASTSGGKINKVRQKLEDKNHIWDILGNVYEWCSDWMLLAVAG